MRAIFDFKKEESFLAPEPLSKVFRSERFFDAGREPDPKRRLAEGWKIRRR